MEIVEKEKDSSYDKEDAPKLCGNYVSSHRGTLLWFVKNDYPIRVCSRSIICDPPNV